MKLLQRPRPPRVSSSSQASSQFSFVAISLVFAQLSFRLWPQRWHPIRRLRSLSRASQALGGLRFPEIETIDSAAEHPGLYSRTRRVGRCKQESLTLSGAGSCAWWNIEVKQCQQLKAAQKLEIPNLLYQMPSVPEHAQEE